MSWWKISANHDRLIWADVLDLTYCLHILEEVNGSKPVYLDNAATSQKPSIVLQAVQNYYEGYNSNVHRGIHSLSVKATEEYELAGIKVAAFINASDSREIVFTRNAIKAINLVAYSWGLSNLNPGDEVCRIHTPYQRDCILGT